MRAKRVAEQEERAREAYLQRQKDKAEADARARQAKNETVKYYALRFGLPLAAGVAAGVLLATPTGGGA